MIKTRRAHFRVPMAAALALCLLCTGLAAGPVQADVANRAVQLETPAPLDVLVAGGAGQITGSVVERRDGGEAGVGGVKVDLFEAKSKWVRGPFISTTATDKDGNFNFEPLPVACFITVAIAPEGRQFVNGTKWRQSYVCVEREEPPEKKVLSAKIEFDQLIEGLVTWLDSGKPVAKVKIDLFEAKSKWVRGRFIGALFTDDQGRVRFEDLAEGCYIVVAIASEGAVFQNGSRWYQVYGCVIPDARPGPDRPLCGGEPVTVYLARGQSPTDGRDVIVGTDAADVIDGGGGPDVICAGGGDDEVQGGADTDLIYGEDGADRISGGPGDDTIEGGPGADQLDGDDGQDTLIGGDDGDRISGGNDADLIYGEDGDDELAGDAGDDLMFGGAGADRMQGADGNDVMAGEAGDDEITAGSGDDEVNAGEGNDAVDGGEGNDELAGGPGLNRIGGGAGDDVIIGGDERDELSGGDGDDEVFGQGGDDVLRGGPADRSESAGDDELDGGLGNDNIGGDVGNDNLLGGPGDDELDGGPGDDRLVGADGANRMTGGPGADVYVEPRGEFAVEADDRVERNYQDSQLGGFFETCRQDGFAVGPIRRAFQCEQPWFLFEHEGVAESFEWGLDVFFDCSPDGVVIGDRCFSPPPPVQTFLDGTEPHHGYFRQAYRTYRSWGLRRPYTWDPYRGLDNWPEATTIGAIFTADDSFGSRSVVPGVIEYGRTPDLSRRQVHRDMFKQFAYAYINDDLRASRDLAEAPALGIAEAELALADETPLESLADWVAGQATGLDNRCTTTAAANCDLASPLEGHGFLLWEYLQVRMQDFGFVAPYLRYLGLEGNSPDAVARLLGTNWRVGFEIWANSRISARSITCPAPCGVVDTNVLRSWAVPGGAVTRGTVGRAVVRGLGGAVVAGLAAEALVQYFMTFDLDAKIEETIATHLFPMLADIPGDDLEITVSQYELLPWTEPPIPPYRNDPKECIGWSGGLGPAMRSLLDRRTNDPNISRTATVAVALYCIDNKIGAAASRSGGTNVSVPAIPGLSFDPSTAETRSAFDLRQGEGSPNHAETNLLASLITGVPINTTSVGIILMLVDNPSDGAVCGFCGLPRDPERGGGWLRAFHDRYPGVALSVIARNNAFQDGELKDVPGYLYDELLG